MNKTEKELNPVIFNDKPNEEVSEHSILFGYW